MTFSNLTVYLRCYIIIVPRNYKFSDIGIELYKHTPFSRENVILLLQILLKIIVS